MGVEDQPGDLVGLVGDHRLGQELGEGYVRERLTRRHPLLGIGGRHTGQHIAGAEGRRLGQQRAQVGKLVCAAPDGDLFHGSSIPECQ